MTSAHKQFGLAFFLELAAILFRREAVSLLEVAGEMAFVWHADPDADLFYMIVGCFKEVAGSFEPLFLEPCSGRHSKLGFEENEEMRSGKPGSGRHFVYRPVMIQMFEQIIAEVENFSVHCESLLSRGILKKARTHYHWLLSVATKESAGFSREREREREQIWTFLGCFLWLLF